MIEAPNMRASQKRMPFRIIIVKSRSKEFAWNFGCFFEKIARQ